MSSTSQETDPPVEPRFASQLEGDGFADAVELVQHVARKEPVGLMKDTLLGGYVLVFMDRATGDPFIHYVLREEGADPTKMRLPQTRFEWVDYRTLTMRDPTKLLASTDTPTYRRARAQPDQLRI